MTFGQKVKFVREKLFLTQSQLAEKLNLSFATINRWETEKCIPSMRAKKLFHEFCIVNKIAMV